MKVGALSYKKEGVLFDTPSLCMTLFIVINKVIKFRTHHQILWQLVDVFIQMAVTDEKDWSQEKVGLMVAC